MTCSIYTFPSLCFGDSKFLLCQGWAGFAFPILPEAVGPSRGQRPFRPSSVPSLTIDGNTAHSTGWWWEQSGAFYFGGILAYNSDNKLTYNAGRSWDWRDHKRDTCNIKECMYGQPGPCRSGCPFDDNSWIRVTNSKAFLSGGIGLVSIFMSVLIKQKSVCAFL